MRKAAKNAVVCLTISAMMFMGAQLGAVAGNGALLNGQIVGIDGKAAAGYTVHLIGENGAVVGQAVSDEQGIYSFPALAAGVYALGIETPDGVMVPVAVAPIQVGGQELARRDVKLVTADAATANEIASANEAVGGWWGGLSTGAKIGVIVGIGAVTWGAIEAFDDDSPSSPHAPMGS